MTGKSVAVTPSQFGVQLFTQSFHTAERDPQSARTWERVVNVLVWVLILRRKDPDFWKSTVLVTGTWALGGHTFKVYIPCEALKSPFPFGMYYWRLRALGGLGANLTEFLTGPLGNSFCCSHAPVSSRAVDTVRLKLDIWGHQCANSYLNNQYAEKTQGRL